MHGLVRQFVRRQREPRVPERARTEHGVVGPDLPVEARQRLLEARIREFPRQHEAAVGRTVEAGDDLVEEDGELGIDAPLDMALEQQHKAEGGKRQRGEHRHSRREQQAQPTATGAECFWMLKTLEKSKVWLGDLDSKSPSLSH
jgi:hypothetical protein